MNTPIQDRLLVLPDEVKGEIKVGGDIIIPEQARAKLFTGEIVHVGDNVVTGGLQPGVRVLYAEYTGREFNINGVRHLVLKEEDILLYDVE